MRTVAISLALLTWVDVGTTNVETNASADPQGSLEFVPFVEPIPMPVDEPLRLAERLLNLTTGVPSAQFRPAVPSRDPITEQIHSIAATPTPFTVTETSVA